VLERNLRVALFLCGQVEACDEIADDGIALARGIFKACAIDDLNVSAAVFDESDALQSSRGEGDARAAGAQHFRQKLLGQFEMV
jgi:hypothetical protein